MADKSTSKGASAAQTVNTPKSKARTANATASPPFRRKPPTSGTANAASAAPIRAYAGKKR